MRRARCDRLAVDQDLALVRPVHAGEDLDQRRFAGAVVADEPERLAALDVEADALQRMDAGIPFVQIAALEMIGVGHASAPPP